MRIENVYILAGGESRRMGRDKLFLPFDDGTLLERCISTCRRNFAHTKVVARETRKFRSLEIPVIIDYPGVAGPLAGILAALHDCHEACFITAADLSDLDSEIISELIENYKGEEFLGLKEKETVQPLCGIYSPASFDKLLKAAGNADYRIYESIMHLDYRLLPVGRSVWRNINTPQDLVR